MPSIVMGTRSRAPVYVGYFLVVTYTDWSQSRQQLWCPKPPLELWEAVIADETVAYATLTRRHRMFRSFNRRLAQAATAPLNNRNQGFCLMR